MDTIKIWDSAVENDASEISGTASYFQGDTLASQDVKTTITANGVGQAAYRTSQQVISTMGQNLEQEASNIRNVGAAFVQYDTMVADLISNDSASPLKIFGD